jgi:hypothetical protein
MKLQSAPQPVLAKLLALDEHAETLADAAEDASNKLEYARAVINGKIEDRRINLQAARAEFDRLLVEAPAKRKRADSEQAVLSACKLYLERLPHDSALKLVPVAPDGLDLTALRAELKTVENEISALRSAPVASSDIAERVARYVSDLAAAGTPLVDGFGPGAQLQVWWPEASTGRNPRNRQGYAKDHGQALLLMARLFPQQLAETIRAEIAAQTAGQEEHPARLVQLRAKRAQLRRSEEALVVKALAQGEPVTRDPSAPPWAVLGVRPRDD